MLARVDRHVDYIYYAGWAGMQISKKDKPILFLTATILLQCTPRVMVSMRWHLTTCKHTPPHLYYRSYSEDPCSHVEVWKSLEHEARPDQRPSAIDMAIRLKSRVGVECIAGCLHVHLELSPSHFCRRSEGFLYGRHDEHRYGIGLS
jgi:hypothetical protein